MMSQHQPGSLLAMSIGQLRETLVNEANALAEERIKNGALETECKDLRRRMAACNAAMRAIKKGEALERAEGELARLREELALAKEEIARLARERFQVRVRLSQALVETAQEFIVHRVRSKSSGFSDRLLDVIDTANAASRKRRKAACKRERKAT